jgi:hypothetical protein
VLDHDDHATGSDHEIIEWCFQSEAPAVDQDYLMRGWSLAPLLGNTEDAQNRRKDASQEWALALSGHAPLTDESTRAELEAQATDLQQATVNMLNKFAKKIKLCARSKRWWSEEIAQRRRDLGRAKRHWKAGRAPRREVREAKRLWQKAIRDAKRRTWEDFLGSATGSEVWSVIRYTKPSRVSTVPTITDSHGNVADTYESKSAMLADMAFPPPVEYDGGAGEEGPAGWAFELVDDDVVRRALYSMSGKKAPGPDGIGASVLRLLWDCIRKKKLRGHAAPPWCA